MVGFNRRFATMAVRMKNFLKQSNEPLAMHYRVNAGAIAPDHWVNDPGQGGGRLLGEVCHFVDFLSFLADAPPVEVHARGLASLDPASTDSVVISLQFADGSQGTISYLTNGDRAWSKERVEAFSGGAVAVLEDFRRLELVRHGRKQVIRSFLRQDKGHRAELEAFASAIRTGGQAPISLEDIVAVTLATLCAAESRMSGQPVRWTRRTSSSPSPFRTVSPDETFEPIDAHPPRGRGPTQLHEGRSCAESARLAPRGEADLGSHGAALRRQHV